MAETLATHDDVEAVKYSNDSHHLHMVNAEGKRGKQIGSDKYLEQWGYDPNVRISDSPKSVPIPVVEAPVEPPRSGFPESCAACRSRRRRQRQANCRRNEWPS